MQEKRYVIYRFVNAKTGKSYIGLTHEFNRRKSDHLNNLKKGTHRNKRLQNAYRKYGVKTFKWFILESGLTKEEAIEAEIKWIAFYDSFNDGYNMTEGGEDPPLREKVHNSIPCVWNGVEYSSMSEAAHTLGVDPETMRYRIRKGYSSDDEVAHKQPCTWNSVEYPSIAEAARITGINQPLMQFYLAKGYSSSADIKAYGETAKIPCAWEGVEYPSITDAARDLGISVGAMRNRLRRYKRKRKP